MPESWSDPLELRFDRLVSAGRQLVDGVSGARPGSRQVARSTPRSDRRRPRLDGLGRWVENKLDWILEDDDDWREPWQDPRPEPRPQSSAPVSPGRRPLDAISRRATPARPGPSSPADPAEWPDDEAFTVPRWQRQALKARSDSSATPPAGGALAGDGAAPPARDLPRSTRRR